MSSNTLDLEELLFADENFREDIIMVNFISNGIMFPFLGKKSVEKFLTYVLNYEKKATILIKEEIDNKEIVSEIWIYKGYDNSWIIGYFISVQEEIEIYISNKNIRTTALLNLVLPLSVEINYEENIRDITSEFNFLIRMYPKLRILEFSDEEIDVFQEKNCCFIKRYGNSIEIEKKKYKSNFLIYPEFLPFYRNYELINSLSLLNYKM